MDQLKEFLKQAVKYRFWIAVGLSALLPMIAYFIASGSLQGETTKQEADITGSQKGVGEYSNGTVVNKDYKPLVEEKTAVLTRDVNASWRELYSRQAPLLTWPPEVEKEFKAWGRKWPEKTAASAVRDTIDAYVRVYPAQVSEVYKSFHPWSPETGEGIVVAPPEAALLQPASYDPNKPPLPGLGKIWPAQEKLWIQRTVLDVIRQVNEKAKAKDWETAVVKQVEALVVASPLAQDQRSAAKGEVLEPAKDIVEPGTIEVAEKPVEAANGSARFARGAGDGGGGGAAAGKAEEVYYLPSPNADQYQIVPIYLSVLIDQSSIPDLLVEFQNSPMGIQVMDMELKRPDERVRKPVKGVVQTFAGGMGNMGTGGRGGMRVGGGGGRGGMGGEGGGEAGYPMMGGSSAYNASAGRGGRGMPGEGGGASARPAAKSGEKNVENANRTNAKADPAAKKDEAPQAPSKISDPYFNVVELRIYGQARFYQPPPPEEPGSESSAAAPAPAAEPEPAKVEAPAKKDEPAKADEPAKKDEPSKKDEAAKPDAPPAEAPKAEPPKAEPPKAEPPKRN